MWIEGHPLLPFSGSSALSRHNSHAGASNSTTGWISDTPSLPFQGSEPISRHASYVGAKVAEPRAGSQALRLLMLYRDRGPHTDHDAAEALGLPLATINARRGWLVQKSFVAAVGSQPGPFQTRNTLWGLS